MSPVPVPIPLLSCRAPYRFTNAGPVLWPLFPKAILLKHMASIEHSCISKGYMPDP